MEKINKLVRDKIPEILEKQNKKCIISILDNEEFLVKLAEELHNETESFLNDFNSKNDEQALKSLANVQEIIYAVLDNLDVAHTSFERLREATKQANGGFDKKICLISVE